MIKVKSKMGEAVMKDIQFECKTKGGFSAQGLPKIYIAAVPDDSKYIYPIIQDVHKIVDCAIYYPVDNSNLADTIVDKRELELYFSEMNLFIFIITTGFLTENNYIRDWMFGLIISKHIQVIPICMEQNIEQLFCQKINSIYQGYGEIQILNKFSKDITEIPYLQKLKIAIDNIFPKEEDYKKISSIFSARVFLSYRKKDRAFAVQLMEQIHSIAGFYRFSIWYDEFLNIGEKWSQEICAKIQNSNVFILLVTDALLEKDNYCVRFEYPEAIKCGIPAIPILMQELDEKDIDLFHRRFPEAEPIVKSNDVKELERVISKYINEEKLLPESEYYTGLAFLNGVGVERNISLAYSLINSAANHGLVKAFEKLEKMYWYGIGIKTDFKMAISWQEKVVEYYKKLFSKGCDLKTVLKLLDAYAELSDHLVYVSDYRYALKVNKQFIEFIRCVDEQCKDGIMKTYFSNAYANQGKIYLRLGEYEKAKKAFEKNNAIMEEMYSEEQSLENLHDLSVSYERKGMLLFKIKKYHEALELYKKALDIRQNLHEQLQTAKSALSLVYIYTEMADIFIRLENYDQAEQMCLESAELLKRVLETDDSGVNRKEYISVLATLGLVYIAKYQLEEAEKYCQMALNMNRLLLTKEKTFENTRDLTIVLNRLGEVEYRKQNYKKSKEFYEESIEIRKKLLKIAGDKETTYDLAVSLFFLAKVYEEGIDRKKGIKLYEDAAFCLKTLLPDDKVLAPHYVYANAMFKVFISDTFHGRKHLEKAIEAMQWLVDNAPDNKKYVEEYQKYKLIYQRCYPKL